MKLKDKEKDYKESIKHKKGSSTFIFFILFFVFFENMIDYAKMDEYIQYYVMNYFISLRVIFCVVM